MRMLAIIALLAAAHPALAMNWEGHDEDWKSEFPPAKAFLDAVPEAKPLPSPDCPMGPVARADNPYEQIPCRATTAPRRRPANCPEASCSA